MKVKLPLVDGYLPEKYGRHAPDEFKYAGQPIVSFPIQISEVPSRAQTLALVLVDYEAIPVAGFTWIHWAAANIPASITEIPEDASRDANFPMIQGKNSNAGGLVGSTDLNVTQRYTGPNPPNEDHTYTLYVYALDSELALEPGYWLNEFYSELEAHALDSAQVEFIGRN